MMPNAVWYPLPATRLGGSEYILPLAKQLMQQVEFHSHPIRLLGLGVSNPGSPSPNGVQASSQGAWCELELEFEPWPDSSE